MSIDASTKPASDPGRRWDLRLLGPAIAAWVGTLIGLHGHAALWVGLGLVAIAAGVHGAASRRMEGPVLALAFLLALASGALARHAFNEAPLARSEDGAMVTVEGVIASDPKLSVNFGSKAVTAELKTIEGARATARIPQDRVTGQISRGATVEVRGRYKQYEDGAPPRLGSIAVSELRMLRAPSPWEMWATKLKKELASTTSNYGGPAGALISGMALGDDRELPEDIHDAMLTASLTHLTAVSGSHVAIALGTLRAVARMGPKANAVMTWGYLVVTVVLVGPTPSVVRASSMGALAAWGLTMRRKGQSIQLLSAVTLGTVLVNPWSAVSLGFILSTTATFGIITLGQYLRGAWRGLLPEDLPLRPAAEALIDAVSIALSAYLATMPALALINPWLPTYGMVANLLVTPLVTPLTLLSLVAAGTVLYAPGVAIRVVRLAAPLASGVGGVALAVEGWPAARMPWIQGPLGVALAAAVSGALMFGALWATKTAGRVVGD